MKKVLYFTMIVLSSLSFVACGDDDEGTPVSSNPQVDAAGVYSGTWTIDIIKKTSPVGEATTTETLFSGDEEGSVTLEESSPYVCTVKFESNALNEYMGTPLEGKLNIAQTTNGYTIYNFLAITSTDNGIIGNGYGGSISLDKELSIKEFKRSDKTQEEVVIGYDRRGRPIKKTAEIETLYTLSFIGIKSE